MNNIILSLQNVNKFYDDLHVLKDLSIAIYKGEFLTLLGPSGCGKTTVLRSIAGFEDISSGDITLKEQSLLKIPANKRSVNTVFQNYALFPHLDIFENIAYGPKMKKTMSDTELTHEVHRMLELVKMTGYEHRLPHQLSGGQMQRIAIARALINNPDILLLDEPLGALDLKLRKHMQYELSNIQKETGTTFVYVTHDQDEALNISDRIAVMNDGRIEQIGTPMEVYNHPKSLFVADFVGERNILSVPVIEQKSDNTVLIRLAGRELAVQCSLKPCTALAPDDKIKLVVHADKMMVLCKEQENTFPATVRSVHYAGSQIRTEVEADGEQFRIVEYNAQACDYSKGDQVFITWQEDGAVLLPLENSHSVRKEVAQA